MTDDTQQKTLGARVHDRIAHWVGRPGFWLLFVCIIASYPFIHAFTHELPEPLPVLSTVTVTRVRFSPSCVW